MFKGHCMIKNTMATCHMGLAAIAVSHSGSVSMIRLIAEASESSSLIAQAVFNGWA